MRCRQLLLIVALVGTTLLVSAADGPGSSPADRRIDISGGVVVAAGDTVHGPVVSVDGPARIAGTVTDDVVVGNGDLRISGRVTGDVLVVNGDVTITGRVGGDIVALLGQVTVRGGARVAGDVVSRRPPNVARGTVHGDVKRVNPASLLTTFVIAFLAFMWVAMTVSLAVLGLLFVWLFPHAADVAAAAGKRPARSLGWGVIVGVVGPFAAVAVLVTLVGLPFGVGMLAGLTVLTPLAYVTTSLVLGRVWVKGASTGARLGAFFAGFGILRVAALIPGIGVLVWLVACTYGLGALAVAAWFGGHGGNARAAPPSEPREQPDRGADTAVEVEAGAEAGTGGEAESDLAPVGTEAPEAAPGPAAAEPPADDRPLRWTPPPAD